MLVLRALSKDKILVFKILDSLLVSFYYLAFCDFSFWNYLRTLNEVLQFTAIKHHCSDLCVRVV